MMKWVAMKKAETHLFIYDECVSTEMKHYFEYQIMKCSFKNNQFDVFYLRKYVFSATETLYKHFVVYMRKFTEVAKSLSYWEFRNLSGRIELNFLY